MKLRERVVSVVATAAAVVVVGSVLALLGVAYALSPKHADD